MQPARSVSEILDLVVVEPEEVRDFVDHRAANLLADRGRATVAFDQRPVEEDDAVWKRHPEIVAATRERQTFVETEERIAQRIEASRLHLFRGRLLFDEDRHVFHTDSDLAWKRVQGFFDQPPELAAVHVLQSAPGGAPVKPLSGPTGSRIARTGGIR
jgi:hypothetical protein